MKNKRNVLYSLIIMLAAGVNFTVQAQGPKGIVRTITQDKKGNTWMASWQGVFKYDGKSFTNVTASVSPARFFSVLQDKNGKMWFGSIGSGVYYYDGKSFQNFTTAEGLAGNDVTSIYQDASGGMWFGTNNGTSRYDGKSFRNLKMSEAPVVNEADSVYTGPAPVAVTSDSVHVSSYEQRLPKVHWMHNDVNAIIEDNTGKMWLGTRGYATIYDGDSFTTITNNDGKPFTNVRSIIKDKKGNIWLGGADGLWRYDGKTFTNVAQGFVGYVYQDKKGNIWTSSEKDSQTWALLRYDANTLYNPKQTVTEITTKPMIFGILEAPDGNIWFGDFEGAHRYDGKTIIDF